MEPSVLVAGFAIAGGAWGLAADRIGARWPAHEDEIDEAGAIVRREPLQGKGHVVRRMFSDIEADVYVMVDGDATFLNEELAKHYGIPGVEGPHFRRVDGVRQHSRGSVLTLAITRLSPWKSRDRER